MISTFAELSPPADPLDAQPAEPAADELLALAQQVAEWRQARGFSISQLCRHVSTLNHKTQKRLEEGDLSELIPENHLVRYRAALTELAVFDQRQQADPILPGLAPTREVVNAVSSLRLQRDIDRFLLVEGESGAGKSSALRHITTQDPDAILVSAHEGWARPLMAITELLTASGFSGTLPNGFSARHAALIKRLAAKPRLICVDEGQHMEIRTLNVLKDVVNRTGCWVVVATMASLWSKIQTRNWSEVKQLLHNRMHLRITLMPPSAGEVEEYLASRLALEVPEGRGKESDKWMAAFENVATGARSNGGYAFCRKVANAARLMAMQKGGTATQPDHLTSAAALIIANTRGFDR